MTQSCRIEGARGYLLVPPMKRADAEQRRQRGGGSCWKPGFPHAPEPKAEVAA
jgi:hypothetical protein